MPESEQDKAVSLRLSVRIETHRKEAQSLLKQGGEQPQYEFKRLIALNRDNLDDRLDFVKLVQAVANSDMNTERCIVIGGDPREKKFYPVTNSEEFDAANLSKILGSYLDPVPLFQSYMVASDEGEPFVLIVLESNQPRPIVVIKQGQTEKGKSKLEEGDIWIKKNTNTVRAKRADIDLMYKVRMEEEAEDRARKRVTHLLELLPSAQPSKISATTLPTFELIVGPKSGLRSFGTELIATADRNRFNILLEICRETLVEGWDTSEIPVLGDELIQFFSKLNDLRTNQFLPALDAAVELGLLGIKHNVNIEWLGAIVDLLVEAFNASKRLIRLQMYSGAPYHWWRPAFDIYVGIRTLAAYAILRERLQFLAVILPHTVLRVSANQMYHEVKTPVVFWPFGGITFESGALNQGRAQYFWNDRVAATWGTYFGNLEKFVAATSQLEFLLEFNSYLGTNHPKDQKLMERLSSANDPQIEFGYVPDLYSQDLQTTVPIAERLYDKLASEEGFPTYLAIDPRLRFFVSGDLTVPQRLELYGAFLYGLKAWQSRYRFEAMRAWGFMLWDWPGRLKKIADAFAEKEKTKKLSGTQR